MPTASPTVGMPSQSTGSGTSSAAAGQGGAGTSMKDKASEVADQATEVMAEARSHAGEVVEEARGQAQDLFFEARRELGQKAEQEVQQVATGLRGLGEELRTMAQGGSPHPDSMPAQLARQAADMLERAATQLDQGGLSAPTRELKRYARSHPGRFLGYAFVAGALSGRLARNVAARGQDGGNGSSRTAPTPWEGSSAAARSDIDLSSSPPSGGEVLVAGETVTTSTIGS